MRTSHGPSRGVGRSRTGQCLHRAGGDVHGDRRGPAVQPSSPPSGPDRPPRWAPVDGNSDSNFDVSDIANTLITHLLPLQDQFGGAADGAHASRPLAHDLADLYRLVDEEQAAADSYPRAEQVARAWHAAHHVDTARRAAAALPPPGARHRTFAP
ncbi:hypothetical protein G9272_00785 [Streptomyces asoensis]|uniref:Uncharacterized protein n=1 Tax=Streptomyces asoensis TaxID=249586 RepID=A0A6M4WRX5_9ACTN|nr:hypothetical protein [Streptomyces asoensis]QJS99052.1 hypothetical protein G9272_00785 [Streptomyces asoensis]